MSFQINTNVTAMNALMNLSNTSDAFSQSIYKLSTGLRINSGADDPSGLIKASGFSSQISGITQALQNNQDAVNFSKTAEGALSEVNSLLNDARSLAVASANTGTLDSNQIQANQAQLNSIVASITRIANNTQFGTKKLLDGSAGVVGSVTDGADFSAIHLSGTFNSTALTTNSAVTVSVTTAATQASVASKAFAFGTTTMSAGSFTINGSTFSTSATDTVNTVVAEINAAQGQTGVRADYTTGGAITLTQTNYGSHARIDLSDANAVLLAAAGSSSATGVDAVATVSINNGSGVQSVTFTGGQYGQSALTLSDTQGNSISLTTAGNTVQAKLAGQAAVGSAQFQIGANAGQTASLSLGNMAATQLGQGAVSGLNLSNLDLTTGTGATNALKVIDQAISDVSTTRGNIGNFQRNVIQANITSLGTAKTNLSATLSSLQDVDVASEMTNFTRLQILQQSGMSVLAQANAAPQSVLKLLG